jgi:signal transduction histidine kinase
MLSRRSSRETCPAARALEGDKLRTSLAQWLLTLLPVAAIFRPSRRATRPEAVDSPAATAGAPPGELLRALETGAALREVAHPAAEPHPGSDAASDGDGGEAAEPASEAAVSPALVRVGRELIGALSSGSFLHRLCGITAEVLGCDMSHTLMLLPEGDVFIPIASEDESAERREALRQVRVPRALIGDVLDALERDDVVAVGAIPEAIAPQLPELADYESLCMALRRGSDIIGLQTAQRPRSGRPFSAAQLEIARGIAQLASLALNHARTVEELEQANRIKSDFVATMSHELRTPLHVILGYADLLLAGEFGELAPLQAETIDRLLLRARELHELIVSTLDVSRIDSGRAILNVGTVSVAGLVAAVEAESQRWVARGEPSFSVHVAADVPALRTDATKLKVVLKNLVGNAFKFTERGEVAIDVRPRDGGVAIAVSDTGIGIAPEVLATLFQPFRQGDPSPSRRYGGVGLGLYIVRRLLDLLGGLISVQSEPGKGSTFTVWLPLEPPQGRAVARATHHTAASADALAATKTAKTPS